MSTTQLPTPQDQSLLLQATVTKTASFSSAALDLGAGFAPGGLGMPAAAILLVSALDVSSGDESYTFVIEDSGDNVTFAPVGASQLATATGAIAVSGRVTRQYVRLKLTVSGTTPTITCKAWLNPLP
jgi:hypothetical protein